MNRARMSGFFVLLAIFGVYLYGLFPTVAPRDSGELTTAASILGIPHAPGYPLYAIVGRIFSEIPLGNKAYRLNLMSLFFSVFSLLILYGLLWELTKNFFCALFGSLALAFSASFWRQTSHAEVFSMNTFFIFGLLALGLFWLRRPTCRIFYLASLIFGLSLGNHHIILFCSLGFLYLIWKGRALLNPKILGGAFLFFLLGTSIYAYLPVRSFHHPPLDEGEPNSVSRFVDVLLRRNYGTLRLSPGTASPSTGRQLEAYLKNIVGQFTPALLAIFLFGAFKLGKDEPFLFIFLLLIFLPLGVGFILLARMPADGIALATVERFYPASFSVLAIFGGPGLSVLRALLSRAGPWVQRATLTAVFFVPVGHGLGQAHAISQRQNYYAYDYGRNILRSLPLGSCLLPVSDTIPYVLSYLFWVEGIRGDVRMAGNTKSKSALHWFERHQPELLKNAASSDEKIELLLERSEDPLAAAIVVRNIDRFPLYAEGMQTGLVNLSAPVGLVSRLLKETDVKKRALFSYEHRQVWQFYVERAKPSPSHDSFTLETFDAYVEAHHNTAVFFEALGMNNLAVEEESLADYWRVGRKIFSFKEMEMAQ